ncbi:MULTISPECIES: DUF2809 domain-containing protein [Pseudomonas]|uniref:DUF2809 domain-containing protein n=2 Tax=Pseudomonas luteola TaxID=47886 RepID=A0ABS0FR66_PSELU|nr:DUF2809 domain-containing protein [Pseudomonas sp.]MBF8642864.1 DUF2809 domain-containing protein [Pseudomonas zeshuii]RRW44994.1 DUF2809 domain-containing protein [Pseudomonas luteola]
MTLNSLRAPADCAQRNRNRLHLGLALCAVIALGLTSRQFPIIIPDALGKYPGDALWALMILTGLALIARRANAVCLAVTAFGISCAVEATQLYQAPWINAIRHHPLGHIALGTTFSWMDIVAYGIGILAGVLIDGLARLTVKASHSLKADA